MSYSLHYCCKFSVFCSLLPLEVELRNWTGQVVWMSILLLRSRTQMQSCCAVLNVLSCIFFSLFVFVHSIELILCNCSAFIYITAYCYVFYIILCISRWLQFILLLFHLSDKSLTAKTWEINCIMFVYSLVVN